MKTSKGRVGRVFVIRLEDGDVVPDCIERFAAEQKMSVAMSSSSAGLAAARRSPGRGGQTSRSLTR